jgi:UDP-glucuronate 4-epimerase
MRTILVTGAAGFVGYHVVRRLLERGDSVVGVDNLNPYYDPSLKQSRLEQLRGSERFRFERIALEDRSAMERVFAESRFDRVIHLAAQAGVRYSLQNPHAYMDSNIVGFLNVLEGCRHAAVGHLVYASSSSVYGANTAMPFSVGQTVDHPVSLYAASKKANELMAHTYSWLYRIPTTGLRFFTVYGPWGRPDMAYFSFTRAILAGEPIPVFGHGRMRRDFTYIDDVVEGVIRTMDVPASPDPAWDPAAPSAQASAAPYRIYNIGNHDPVPLLDMIELLGKLLDRPVRMDMLPTQPGDVEATFADVSALQAAVGFSPSTPLETGLRRFVDWYRDYYEVRS